MRTFAKAILVPLALCLAPPVSASEFVVVSVIAAVEPPGLAVGQQLSEGTHLGLEPWGRALIRETTKCGSTHVVAGVADYVLTLSDDCAAVDEPMTVAGRVQRGEVFAARLGTTGSGLADDLASALVNEPCVFLPRVSEEGDSRRRCPSGYALRGLRCTGLYCDDKDLLCCPYLEGAADASTKELKSRWISEERPNTVESESFLDGLTCDGSYCDNLLANQFESSHLVNDRQCVWSVWSTARPGDWLDCSLGRFVAGLRCRGDYCAEVALYCCGAKVE